MKNIIIIGSGGHAAELREYLNHFNAREPKEPIQVLGFIDDDALTYSHYGFKEPYLGSIKEHLIDKNAYYLMAIANLAYRQPIIERFMAEGARFTGFIHPTAIIASTAQIGEGTVISHNASVGPLVQIGKFNMLNSRCTIGHDSVIGNYNFISPQVAVSGNTHIGNGNLIGTNSCTIPGIQIGDNNKIGAGTSVIMNVGDNLTVVGNKPRVFENKIQ